MNEHTKGPEDKFCQTCGEMINLRAEICPKCGVRQTSMMNSTSVGNKRLAAIIFAIVLGSFGVHKFYLGRTGQGILYLVFFWTAIPGIVGFIEGIIYLTMNDLDFEAKYGQTY